MKFLPLLVSVLFLIGCQENRKPAAVPKIDVPNGKLFVIGGGKRPPGLVKDLIRTSEIGEKGYAVILPMSSGEPDTAAFYAIKQFTDLGLSAEKFTTMQLTEQTVTPDKLDSLKNAQLIYLTGGDQRKFMDLVEPTKVPETIRAAYQRGATVAGTSAGAALMSGQMITGDEKKHPEYTGDFRTIEAENIILRPGLGLTADIIFDQHFIYRMRMNRLLTLSLEYPDKICVGIDESTAFILTEGNKYRIGGDYQVILLQNKASEVIQKNGLLGGQELVTKVLLSGDRGELTY